MGGSPDIPPAPPAPPPAPDPADDAIRAAKLAASQRELQTKGRRKSLLSAGTANTPAPTAPKSLLGS